MEAEVLVVMVRMVASKEVPRAAMAALAAVLTQMPEEGTQP